MFTDSAGRMVTAGQWHDEKFYTFTAPEESQVAAPAYLLLGGMAEEQDIPGQKKAGVVVEGKEVEAY